MRTWAAWLRVTPNYFPDEGIYGTLSRSLAHGHLPAVRGQVAHFPALLQPLLTAPAWWFGSLDTGYRITQAIEAGAVSTAALAVWWTARRLGVGPGGAFAAAAISLAVPDAGYAGWVLAEPFAYPLFIAAVGTGAVALARPTRRAQSTFLAFALLATFARMQLAVLLLAYLVSAILLRRMRAQRVVIGGLSLAVLVALAGGLGYYRKAPAAFHLVSPATLGRNLMVLAIAAGWIIVPAGLLGLWGAFARSRSEEERAFGAFALVSGAAVVAEATLYGDGGVVHERYGCYVLPLVAIGFVLYASRGWPWKRAYALLAAMLLVASAVTPMSGWAAAGGNAHSLVLTGLLKVQTLAGSAGDGGLYVVGGARRARRARARVRVAPCDCRHGRARDRLLHRRVGIRNVVRRAELAQREGGVLACGRRLDHGRRHRDRRRLADEHARAVLLEQRRQATRAVARRRGAGRVRNDEHAPDPRRPLRRSRRSGGAERGRHGVCPRRAGPRQRPVARGRLTAAARDRHQPLRRRLALSGRVDPHLPAGNALVHGHRAAGDDDDGRGHQGAAARLGADARERVRGGLLSLLVLGQRLSRHASGQRARIVPDVGCDALVRTRPRRP